MADPITQTPFETAAPNKEIDALIVKHRVEIDRVKMLSSQGQQEVFRELGVDPKAIEAHYADLEKQSFDLRKQDVEVNRKVAAVGWTSFGAALAGMYAVTRNRWKIESTLVRRFLIGLSAPAAGLIGSFTASRVIGDKVRDASKQLDIDARNAFERELAVALENREREGGTLPPILMPAPAPAQGLAANVARRDASFTAQAAAEKATPATAQVRV